MSGFDGWRVWVFVLGILGMGCGGLVDSLFEGRRDAGSGGRRGVGAVPREVIVQNGKRVPAETGNKEAEEKEESYCPEGMILKDRACWHPCSVDADCGDGRVCVCERPGCSILRIIGHRASSFDLQDVCVSHREAKD